MGRSINLLTVSQRERWQPASCLISQQSIQGPGKFISGIEPREQARARCLHKSCSFFIVLIFLSRCLPFPCQALFVSINSSPWKAHLWLREGAAAGVHRENTPPAARLSSEAIFLCCSGLPVLKGIPQFHRPVLRDKAPSDANAEMESSDFLVPRAEKGQVSQGDFSTVSTFLKQRCDDFPQCSFKSFHVYPNRC